LGSQKVLSSILRVCNGYSFALFGSVVKSRQSWDLVLLYTHTHVLGSSW
jgi:hypothetical protein